MNFDCRRSRRSASCCEERRESCECIPDGLHPYSSSARISRVLSIPSRERTMGERTSAITDIPEDALAGVRRCFLSFARIRLLLLQRVEQGIDRRFEVENVNRAPIISEHQRGFAVAILNDGSLDSFILSPVGLTVRLRE